MNTVLLFSRPWVLKLGPHPLWGVKGSQQGTSTEATYYSKAG